MTIEEGTFIVLHGVAYLIECVLKNNHDKFVGIFCSDAQGNERFVPCGQLKNTVVQQKRCL